jgi:sulfur carrier protein ThiS
MPVKLVLRDKEYEVKPGMTLLDSLKKIGVLSESVIATRAGEMILDDEILKDGETVKLIAVISGGSCLCEPERQRATRQSRRGMLSHLTNKREIASGWVSIRNDTKLL